MSHQPPAASHQPPAFADRALQARAPIVENVRLARDTYRVRLRCPEIARRIAPGQFAMLKLPGCDDPLLGRPLALYDTVLDESGEPVGIDVVYLVVGKMTRLLAELRPGVELDLWGPLGNGFSPTPAEHLVMVAGGIGNTPFLALARQYAGLRRYGLPEREVPPAKKITFCYGVRSKDYLAGLDDFERIGLDLKIGTDDGTAGHHGFVTDLLEATIRESEQAVRVVCCGPEPMLEAVSKIAARHNLPCEVSLETPMACGVGICFSCVARVKQPDGGWDYKRTCVEGPVFDAAKLAW
jgi:dihydroorotate dehydrogenase electron transfer subunit